MFQEIRIVLLAQQKDVVLKVEANVQFLIGISSSCDRGLENRLRQATIKVKSSGGIHRHVFLSEEAREPVSKRN